MEEAKKIFYLSALIFLIITLLFNIILRRFPKIPGDIYIDRYSFRIYIPFASVIVLTIITYIFILPSFN